MAIPGRDLGLRLLLRRDARRRGRARRPALPGRRHGRRRQPDPRSTSTPIAAAHAARRRPPGRSASRSSWRDFSDYTLLIAKRDPGQGIVWIAFLCLIAGITITFYLPRRRIWARLAAGRLAGLVWRSDRYVDVEREFGRLLDDLVAARGRPEHDRARDAAQT